MLYHQSSASQGGHKQTMTAIKTLETGIQAIQSRQYAEGARFVRIALKSSELTAELRSVAYCWLAETRDDFEHKRACYSEALIADPNNADAQQRLSVLLASQLPPMPNSLPENSPPGSTGYTARTMPLPSGYQPLADVQSTPTMPVSPTPTLYSPAAPPAHAPAQSYSSNIAEHLVGVIGGPNGMGSGFFISPEGIVATTRFIVGGMERMTVELQPGQQVPAVVVRAFSELDLVFMRLEVAPRTALPITPQPRVPDDAPLAIYPYGRKPLPGAQRPTKRALAAHWIPTTYTQLGDVGGAPVFDQQHYLVGMMTGNTSRNSGHTYVLHIAAIRARLQAYLDELRSEARAYCPSCGANSRAGGAGFYYCEVCGGIMPRAQYVTRQPLPQAEYYYGVSGIRCTQCASQSGMYNGKCLRCGQTQELKR
jgi:hypothetical protein